MGSGIQGVEHLERHHQSESQDINDVVPKFIYFDFGGGANQREQIEQEEALQPQASACIIKEKVRKGTFHAVKFPLPISQILWVA